MKKNKKIAYLRWAALTSITIMVTYAAYLHQKLGGGKAPSIHALCPYGGLESLYQVFSAGSLIPKVFAGTMILFVITLVLALVFRRSFCGLLCPFGAIQELFAILGKKILGKRYILPTRFDRPARYLKYFILGLTAIFAWRTAGLWMTPYDPWAAYGHLSTGIANVWQESAIGLCILIISLAGSFVYDRFFCKYLCPMGAFLGIVGKISPFHIERNIEKCTNCGKCSKVCPVNIDVKHEVQVRSAECINCQTCVINCPEKEALEMRLGKILMPSLATIILVIGLFFGAIFVSQSIGIYTVLPQQDEGQIINPADVEGYLTIDEAAKATKMEIKEFYKMFQIPDNIPPETKMKEISELVPGYDFHQVKDDLR